ncbi:MAG: hypothetical protein GYA36_18815, partial [Veillonellaceae bacterium]|nr:hypothetical protein [Veillonellaceae bacterium]
MTFISGIKLQNIVLMALLLLSSCQEKSSLALLTTEPITEVTGSSALSGGNISSDGGSDISERGVCWATHTGPTINDKKTTDGSGKGSFTSTLSDLQPATPYYVRAYATNSTGTAYGNELTFVTDTENPNSGPQIIADHTVVDKYDDIPEYYINEVKKMWLSVPGESHATAYIFGLELL